MSEKAITLTVTEARGTTPLKPGDRWLIRGREPRPVNAKLCLPTLCALYPRIKAYLEARGPEAPFPAGPLRCSGAGWEVVFQAEPGAPRAEEGEREGAEQTPAKGLGGIRHEGPFLARMPPEVSARLVSACTPKRFPDGALILEEGRAGAHLFIVGEGEVEVLRKTPTPGQENETVLAVLDWGECFGEMSLLTGARTSASVRAKGPVTILLLTRKKLEEQLAASPALNRVFSQLLADRLRALNTTLERERGRGIRGKLRLLALPELVQTLHGSRRSGTLVLTRKKKRARIGFTEGQVTGAELDELEGAEAFHALVNWPDGEFVFQESPAVFEEQARINGDVLGLLMESMRRLDETQRLYK